MQINQRELNVHCQGHGPLFIWGHGLMASMQSEDILDIHAWSAFPDDLQLIRYDARGHGLSEPAASPAGYHWAELGKDMNALAQLQVGTEGYVGGGQSMGSATALYAAMQNPQQVRGLVLMTPPTAWDSRAEQGAFYRKKALIGGLLGGRLLARSLAHKLDRLLPTWLLEACADRVPGVLEGFRGLRRRTVFNLLRGAALTDLPAKADIAQLQVPTLILAWTDDATHPLKTAETLAQLLPNAQLHVANSYAQVEQWPRLIHDFVRTVSACNSAGFPAPRSDRERSDSGVESCHSTRI